VKGKSSEPLSVELAMERYSLENSLWKLICITDTVGYRLKKIACDG